MIVGLGNPGPKYEHTRHNLGFLVLDELASQWRVSFEDNKKFQALTATATHGSEKIILVKPQTFMNLSGESVGPLAHFHKVSSDHVMAVFDDLDLPYGRLRFAQKGSAGGHNGIKSLIQHLGTQDFPRLKVGIGRPRHPGQEVVAHVLEKFSKEESQALGPLLKRCADGLETWLSQGLAKAMNQFNQGSV